MNFHRTMLANKCKVTSTVTNKMCDEGELHRVEIERSDKSLQVLDAKPMVSKRPHLKTHLEHDVRLPTYEESQAKYAKRHKLKLVGSTKKLFEKS